MFNKEFEQAWSFLTTEQKFETIMSEIVCAEDATFLEGKDVDEYTLEDKAKFVELNEGIFDYYAEQTYFNTGSWTYEYPYIITAAYLNSILKKEGCPYRFAEEGE